MYQIIDYQCKTLAYIIPKNACPDTTTFVTQDECNQQVGYIVKQAGEVIHRHYHEPIKRETTGTTEVLVVIRGHCMVEFYDDDKTFVSSKDLYQGDVIIIVAGGHGFKMIEDTVLLEVKQGPYHGDSERQRF